MNDLLSFAVDAHGGIDRWNSFARLRAELSIDGAIWNINQQPALLLNKVLELNTHEESISITPFPGPDTRILFTPGRLVLSTMDGRTIERRQEPEASFGGQNQNASRGIFHVAYWASGALWTYLTSPFLFTYPDFSSEEIDPWCEEGEVWRRLKITFPADIASESKTHVMHFGPDGLMRRHDYTIDILGGATAANYPSHYREVQGLMMPIRRRIYSCDENGTKVREPLLASIDFGQLEFS